MARVFVSHASADNAHAVEIRKWLLADGHQVFLDLDGLLLGEDWKQRLYAELHAADAVVCLISPASLDSNWCAVEIGAAGLLGCLLLPLRIARSEPHPLIGEVQFADYQADPKKAQRMLIDRLRRLDEQGRGIWPAGQNPFPGLAAFTEAFSPMFFGRERDALRLADLLRASLVGGPGILAVSGASGCGKSSLLAAGLIPKLRADGSWLAPAPFSPGKDPTLGLVRRLTELGHRHDPRWTPGMVRAALDKGESGLARLAEELLMTDADSEHRLLLLTVDQGEELFTRSDPARLNRFALLVRAAITGPVRVVVGLRSEYLDDLQGLPALADAELGSYVLRPLDQNMLALAITGPAKIAGLRLEDELLPTLLADTRQSLALPLLAFTLRALAESKHRGDILTVADYHALGGVDGRQGGVSGVLTRYADQALDRATTDSGLPVIAVLRVLTRLAGTDDTGRRTSRRIREDRLRPAQREAISAFVAARLLTSDADDSGAVWVTLVHEALLTAWPPLDTALTGRAAARNAEQSVERAADEWAAAGSPPDAYLWDRDRLLGTLKMLADGADDPEEALEDLTGPARAFLDATRAHLDTRERHRQEAERLAARRRTTRRRAVAAFATVLAVVAASVLTLILQQHSTVSRQNAERRSQRLAALADSLRATDPAVALQLSLAAYRSAVTPQARASLYASALTPYDTTLKGHSGPVNDLAISPDQHVLASSGADHTIRLWNVTDPLHPAPKAQAVMRVGTLSPIAFSPDRRSHLLVAAGVSAPLVAWDVTNPLRPVAVADLATATGEPSAVAFHPDGHTLATAVGGVVQLWDLTSPHSPVRIRTLLSDPAGVHALAFSPDGRVLATAGGTVRLWDASNPRDPHPGSVLNVQSTSLAFSPDNRFLATPTTRTINTTPIAAITVWNATDPRHATIRNEARDRSTDRGEVIAASFEADTRAPRADAQALIVAINQAPKNGVPTQGIVARIPWNADSSSDFPQQIDTSGDGRPVPAGVSSLLSGNAAPVLASGGSDGTIRLWVNPTTSISAQFYEDEPAFSPDGRMMAFPAANGKICLLDVTDANPTEATFLPGLSNVSIFFVGRTLVTAGSSGIVRLWDAPDARRTRLRTVLPRNIRLEKPPGTLNLGRAIPSPDGHTIALLDPHDDAVHLWDLTDPGHPRESPTALPETTGISFSPDGHLIIGTTTHNRIQLWDVTNPRHPLPRSFLPGAEKLPDDYYFEGPAADNRTLITQEGNRIHLWDVTDPSHPKIGATLSLPATSSVQSGARSADGRIFAFSDMTGHTIRVWDVSNPYQPASLSTINNATISNTVERLHFYQDDHLLIAEESIPEISTTFEKNERAWDLFNPRNPTERAGFRAGMAGLLTFVVPNPQGSVAAVSKYNRLYVLDLDTRRLDHHLCSMAGNSITREQWTLYSPDLSFQAPCA
jgi:WD40 repeat protein